LQASNYVWREIAANLQRFPPLAAQEWPALAARLSIVRDLTCFDYPAVHQWRKTAEPHKSATEGKTIV